jgi:hypothetical protein
MKEEKMHPELNSNSSLDIENKTLLVGSRYLLSFFPRAHELQTEEVFAAVTLLHLPIGQLWQVVEEFWLEKVAAEQFEQNLSISSTSGWTRNTQWFT